LFGGFDYGTYNIAASGDGAKNRAAPEQPVK